jgi:hypothetical protein
MERGFAWATTIPPQVLAMIGNPKDGDRPSDKGLETPGGGSARGRADESWRALIC